MVKRVHSTTWRPLGLPTPQLREPVMDLVTSTLCRIARARRGDRAGLRSRSERAPADGVSTFSG
ncbi:MAG TPA: hypothetical protein VFC19_34175 [Candidatus Limnocylindrales bacterium]|nr:hypothetical protein [Candidatus Limnocylindrales bacterium]